MSPKRNQSDRSPWTTQQFLSLGKTLEQDYGSEVNNGTAKQEDFWTTDKFISMSRHLSSAYGVDF